MKIPANPFLKKHTRLENKGAALVLTLLVISLLVIIVVGFTNVVQLEQAAARNFSHRNTAQQLAQLATGQAMGKLSEALQAGKKAGAYSTQSGRLHPLGEQAQNLFSQGTTVTNLNAATSSGFVTGSLADNIEVGFQDVLSKENKLIGRTAFYITDESTKLPINNAIGQRSSLNPAPPRPFSLRGLDDNIPQDAIGNFTQILTRSDYSNNTISNWSYFFTPEQLSTAISGIGADRLRRATVAMLQPNPPPTRTPWGSPKIYINEVALEDASVDELVAALTDPKLSTIFGAHFGNKYGENGVVQLAANILQMRSAHWKDGANFSVNEPALGTAELPASVTIGATSDIAKKTHGIPERFLGYTPFPMIRHIALGAVYGWTQPNRMTVKVFLECELFNPFPIAYLGGGQIVAQIDKARFNIDWQDGFSDWRGPDGTAQKKTPHNNRPNSAFNDVWDPWGAGDPNEQTPGVNLNLTPLNGIVIINLPSINSNSSETVFLDFTMTFDEGNENANISGPIYCIIDNLKILAQQDDPKSIKDWCSGNDFFNALAASADGPAQFQISANGPFGKPDAPVTLPDSDAAPPPTDKLVRFDPRMRPTVEVSKIHQTEPPGKAWLRVGYGDDPPTSADFLGAKIPADKGFQNNIQSAIFNPKLPPFLQLETQNFCMPPDLGKVFTGMPWRTLRMQPQPTTEANAGMIPDWVLLDLIDFTNQNSRITPVNPNIQMVSLQNPVGGYGSGLRSQMDALVDTRNRPAPAISNNQVRLIDPITGGNATVDMEIDAATFDGGTLNSILSNLQNIASSRSWSVPIDGWFSRREGLGFPKDSLLIPSELVEINGIANFNNVPDSFKLNEYRLGTLFPGLTTQSQFFQIYSIGQAMEGNPPNVVSTSLLQTLIEVDNSTNPPTFRTILQYPPSN